jgi:hypothetical protein
MRKFLAPRLAVATAVLALGCTGDGQGGPQINAATPLDPIQAVLDAFATHDMVALGDFHHDPQLHDFRMTLIADPRFPDVVRDVVFEFGTPQQQVLLDRYVAGDDVSSEELRASADGIFAAQFLDHSPMYRDFLAAVRDLNATLPPEKHIRIVLAETPELTMESEAANIRRLTAGHKALLVIGTMHLPRKPLFIPVSNRELAEMVFKDPSSVSTTAHLEAAGVRVFSVYPLPADVAALAQPNVSEWATPALAVVAGTPIGAEPFATFAPTDTLFTVPDAEGDGVHYERVPPDPARSGLTEEQVDAVLVLAPSTGLPFGEQPPLE